MTVQPLTMPAATPVPAEPTHRFGRALDDRLPFASSLSAQKATAASKAEATQETTGMSFDDVLDIINPLQHLPVISTLYREMTGDEIGPAAKVVGGGLFGGIIGAAASLVDIAVEQFSGNDMGGHIMTALFSDEPTPDERSIAEAQTVATPVGASATTPTTPTMAPVHPASTTPAMEPSPPPAGIKTDRADASAPVPNMSADAFDALMRSFGANEESDRPHGENNGHISLAPGLAYAAPARAGQVLDTAL
ncbi:hypothetical protein [Pyruvatibacter sp.]|uniref:hypothetical protein n=1 Tax=Pyruvatibacter sp. TaxID=1981328 RepID=UPI0032EDC32E